VIGCDMMFPAPAYFIKCKEGFLVDDVSKQNKCAMYVASKTGKANDSYWRRGNLLLVKAEDSITDPKYADMTLSDVRDAVFFLGLRNMC
jgi:hypothetical protein